MKDITIAIDGYAGCGKSTTARTLAERLNYLYIDSGAMYRAVSLYLLRNQVPFDKDSEALKDALDNIYIDFKEMPGSQHPLVILNGKDVTEDVRLPEISNIVSQVSVHASVRKELVQQQQRMGDASRVVMDGRDIGTVVFPHAELKLFMTARMEVRAQRRQEELRKAGIDMSLDTIILNLKERDRIDSTRPIAPLRKAPDAIEIDTSDISFDQQVDQVHRLAMERIS